MCSYNWTVLQIFVFSPEIYTCIYFYVIHSLLEKSLTCCLILQIPMITGRKVQTFIPAASSGFREGLEIIYPVLSVSDNRSIVMCSSECIH